MIRLLGVACALAASIAVAADPPAPKVRAPGLWEVKLHRDSPLAPIRIEQCSAAASEPEILLSIVPGQEHCEPPRLRPAPGKLVIETHCRVHGKRVDATLTLEGDRRSAYSGSFRVEERITRFDARHLGDCRPGMKAGDMVLSNGIVVNVLRDNAARREHKDP